MRAYVPTLFVILPTVELALLILQHIVIKVL